MLQSTNLKKEEIVPHIGKMFTLMAAGVANDGYKYFALLPNDMVWIKDGGKIGLLTAEKDNPIDIREVTQDRPFVAFSAGASQFYSSYYKTFVSDRLTVAAVAFPSRKDRDALIQKIFEHPFYDAVKRSVIKAEWKNGKLDVPLEGNTVPLGRIEFSGQNLA